MQWVPAEVCHSCDVIQCVRHVPCRAILEGVDKFGNLFVQVGLLPMALKHVHKLKNASTAAKAAAVLHPIFMSLGASLKNTA